MLPGYRIIVCYRLGDPSESGHDPEYESSGKGDDDETGHGAGPKELYTGRDGRFGRALIGQAIGNPPRKIIRIDPAGASPRRSQPSDAFLLPTRPINRIASRQRNCKTEIPISPIKTLDIGPSRPQESRYRMLLSTFPTTTKAHRVRRQ